MRLRWLTLAALTLIIASGCGPARRRHDTYQELLDAEKRYLEDQLYDLQYDFGVLKDQYESTTRENEALRRDLQQRAQGGAASSTQDGPTPSNATPDLTPRADALRPRMETDDIAPPQIELGEPAPSNVEGLPITPPDELQPSPAPAEPSPGSDPTETSLNGPDAVHEDLVDPRVTHLYINPLLTGGANSDHEPGDDGLSIVVEPRNAAGKYVAVAGPLSIVVLDPAKQGEAARVARWDFSVQETRELMRSAAFGKGVHIRLPWPSEPPDSTRLHVFVRFTTPDGTKLEMDREVFVEPPGHVSSRWTPHAPSDAAQGASNIVAHSVIAPNDATGQSSISVAAEEKTSPPAGPTVSEVDGRPQWRPYR